MLACFIQQLSHWELFVKFISGNEHFFPWLCCCCCCYALICDLRGVRRWAAVGQACCCLITGKLVAEARRLTPPVAAAAGALRPTWTLLADLRSIFYLRRDLLYEVVLLPWNSAILQIQLLSSKQYLLSALVGVNLNDTLHSCPS